MPTELQFFARQAQALGVRELVMPLIYVDFAPLHAEDPADDLIALVKDFQWENWTDLRFAEPTSSEYRRGVARLAERLAAANVHAESVDLAAAAQTVERDAIGAEDEPGIIDRIAAAEEAMPKWGETLARIAEQISAIGEAMQSATEDMERGDKQGKGFAARLTVARRVARDLAEPSEQI